MSLNLSEESNQIFFFSIIVALCFFFIIMPMIENCQINERKVLKERMENIF
jgi:hypothetical protein